MKVYIGPYVERLVCNIHNDWMEFRYGDRYMDSVTPLDLGIEYLEDFVQSIYNKTINLYLDNKKQKISVKIDKHDIWSADVTLAHIILPVLKEIKKSKSGSPCVDSEDVPEELRAPVGHDFSIDMDANFHKRWDWVLNEMIFAFENIDTLGYIIEHELSQEDSRAFEKRVQNGFELFGKYYRSLWT